MPVADSSTKWVSDLYAKSIVPTLVDYIKIPNKSAMFDPDWKKNGHMDRAAGCGLDPCVVRLGARSAGRSGLAA